MNKYKFEIEYLSPTFADITVETKEDEVPKVQAIAMSEFWSMYPEAQDPVIISSEQVDG